MMDGNRHPRPRCWSGAPRWALAIVGLIATFAGGAPALATDCPPPGQAVAADDPAPLLRDVPSPDWRDQIIYFVLIDRFANGDRCNDDQGGGEYGPDQESHYSGGDIAGIRQQLRYIQGMGATALWITPPVANQWWDPTTHYGGYHGYWARDFSSIDEHAGTLADYQRLASDLHRRGMYLVQDIVVNHVGNFFSYDGHYDPHDRSAGLSFNPKSTPTAAPTEHPFDLNDPRRAADRAAAIYHWTPSISDTSDAVQQYDYQLASLDDINTDTPAVAAAFKRIYGRWIETVGVDAFRIDTVKYVAPKFFADFLHGPGGIAETARRTGRDDFLVFGEVKENAPAFSTSSEAKMAPYFSAPGQPNFPSLLNFPLQEEMIRVIGQGVPTRALRYRLEAMARTFPDPTLATNFVDNHDIPRFLSQGSDAAFRQAMAFMFAVPGIPIIYQGDEQGFAESRQAMFRGGYRARADHFDTDAPMFGHIRSLAALRRAHPALRRGGLQVLADNPVGPGAFAFSRASADEQVIVVMNTADHASLLAAMPTGLPPGTVLAPIFGGDIAERVGAGGALTLALPARAMRFYAVTTLPTPAAPVTPSGPITVDAPPPTPLTEPFALRGSYGGGGRKLQLVIDGNLSSTVPVTVDRDGRWQTIVPVRDLGEHRHIAHLYAPDSNIVSDAIAYTSVNHRPDWTVRIADPRGDDHGATAAYHLPDDPSFDGQQDIVGAVVRGGGDALQLELSMRRVSADWQPSNGFDHVAFAIFFALPGEAGLTRFDELNAPMPGGFRWSAAHLVFGWGNNLVRQPGEKVTPAPQVSVDRARQTITLTYSASSFNRQDWRGARLYVTTYDRAGEGEVRPLTRDGGAMSFRGDPDGAKVTDDLLIELPGSPSGQ